MPRAIFFDMDDTLLDAVNANVIAWETVCAEVAPRLGCDAEKLRTTIRKEGGAFWKDESLVGHWRVDLEGARALVIEKALASLELETSLAKRMAADYSCIHREHLKPFDDAFETLDAVRAAGRHVGMITNGPAALQRDKIERFGIEPYMDVIVIEGEFGRGKPDPAVFRHALSTVGVDAADAWHVGDNLYADIGGAQGVGMQGVWIHRGRLKLQDDSPARPDRIVANLAEIRAAIAG
jgi:putative hydrolase of the HAD superfamily